MATGPIPVDQIFAAIRYPRNIRRKILGCKQNMHNDDDVQEASCDLNEKPVHIIRELNVSGIISFAHPDPVRDGNSGNRYYGADTVGTA